jgi:predicted O-methyltransferase YrrM
MVEDQWTEVDQYFSERLIPHDPILDSALETSVAAGLPAIAVSPNQGKLLQMLAQIVGARSILEIGTLGGYSTIWLARALPASGRLITLELDPKHAEVAQLNVSRAGLQDLVDVRIGDALSTLPELAAERREPFDLIFIDADKPNNTAYFAWALRLSRVGTVIIVDNVVRKGGVIDPASTDENVQGARRFYDALAKETRVVATAIQTVGSKGHDGFAIGIVLSPG